VSGSTRRGRCIDLRLRDHGCPPGWQTETVSLTADGRALASTLSDLPGVIA
jgi:hypothetical protein